MGVAGAGGQDPGPDQGLDEVKRRPQLEGLPHRVAAQHQALLQLLRHHGHLLVLRLGPEQVRHQFPQGEIGAAAGSASGLEGPEEQVAGQAQRQGGAEHGRVLREEPRWTAVEPEPDQDLQSVSL